MLKTPVGRILRRFFATFISAFISQLLLRLDGSVELTLSQIFISSAIAAMLMALDKTLRELKITA